MASTKPKAATEADAPTEPDPIAAAVAAAARNDDGTVTVYPTAPFGLYRVPSVPVIEQRVTPERAAELLAYDPPAFQLEQPAGEFPPAGAPEVQQPEEPAAGASESEEA